MKRRSDNISWTEEPNAAKLAATDSSQTCFRRHQCIYIENFHSFPMLTMYLQVYSPHTAVDCARGGLGDWLADIVTGTPTELSETDTLVEVNRTPSPSKASPSKGTPAASIAESEGKRPVYMLQHHPSQLELRTEALALGDKKHNRYPITATQAPGYPGAGMGRIVRLSEPVALPDIIDRIGLGLGNPKGFPIAIPQGKEASEMMISSIGICAGSGGHLFGEMEAMGEEVDLLFTGELSHHEALAAIEKGKCVICLFHSNTERGFLHSVLKGQLEKAIKEEVSTTYVILCWR
jgi:putative NIF3 family GTP cyclohydrolase 1 type 2